MVTKDDKEWDPEAALGTPLGTPCAIHGCPKPSFSRGLCDAHYKFWRRHGAAALNKRAKRVPRTREEAEALLEVRAIELADVTGDSGPEYKRAKDALVEAARLVWDPKARRRYGAATKRAWREKNQDTMKIARADYKARFIAQYGEQTWRDRRAESQRAYRKRKLKGEKAPPRGRWKMARRLPIVPTT